MAQGHHSTRFQLAHVPSLLPQKNKPNFEVAKERKDLGAQRAHRPSPSHAQPLPV